MTDRLPNLIIPGVAKAGTTSLFHYLSQHDEICASDIKELEYFNSGSERDGALAPITSYASHFASCGSQRYRMEASPTYFYAGSEVIQEMARVLGRPWILIGLRDPVERFWSAYTFLQSLGRLDQDLSVESYLEWCLERGASSNEPTPLSVGRYAEWLPMWFEAFEPNVHILFAEDLFARPLDTVNEVLARLDLSPMTELQSDSHNRTASARSHMVARASYSAKGISDRLFARLPAARTMLRNTYRRLNTRPLESKMPAATRGRLSYHYQGPNAALAEILAARGISDLPTWLVKSD